MCPLKGECSRRAHPRSWSSVFVAGAPKYATVVYKRFLIGGCFSSSWAVGTPPVCVSSPLVSKKQNKKLASTAVTVRAIQGLRESIPHLACLVSCLLLNSWSGLGVSEGMMHTCCLSSFVVVCLGGYFKKNERISRLDFSTAFSCSICAFILSHP